MWSPIRITEKITSSSDSRRLQRRNPTSDGRRPRGRPQEHRGTFLPGHPQHDSHLLRKRVVWVVPVILGPRVPRNDRSAEELNDWARVILLLFLPWRSPADLRLPNESWSAAYERQRHLIPAEHHAIIRNMTVLAECRDARDTARANRRQMPCATLPSVDVLPPSTPPAGGGDASCGDYDVDMPDLDPSHIAASHVDTSSPPKRSLLDVIDDLISVPARCAIDRCFSGMAAFDPSTSYGAAERLTSSTFRVVSAEHTYMRQLKRKRRPSPPPPPRVVHLPFTNRPSGTVLADVTTMSLPTTAAPGASVPRAAIIVPDSPCSLDPRGVIDQVVLEFRLHENVEQLRAFELVAERVCYPGKQLLMYVGGVGGTGKSYVVNAILRLFTLLRRRNQILVSAPTGAAAILIGGYTIHSLLLLPRKEHANLEGLPGIWKYVDYLILDEVSMISATVMYDISERMQHAKGASALAEDLPFGGVNVIFLGDFGQLKPVNGVPLYSRRFGENPTIQDAQNKASVVAIKGIFLWRMARQTVVLLKKNHRQGNDGNYCNLLNRVREGQSGAARRHRSAFDYRMLQGRLIQNFDASTRERFVGAPIIVGRKVVRDALNYRILQHHADSIQATVHVYYAVDKVAGERISGVDQESVWDMSSTRTHDALGRLPLFPGMHVMIQENIVFTHNVVNGAVGTVRDIRYTEEDGRRHVSVVYIEIPGAGRLLGQEEDDVIPVFPATRYFGWTPPGLADPVSVSRLQPPILPAYVYTDYKSQGRSLDVAIIDLDSALTMQGAYVMLSRVRSLDGVAILRRFKASKIEERLNQDIRAEFDRLEERHAITAAEHPTHPEYYHTCTSAS